MRQNAWSDRLTHLRKELDDQRTASEVERTTLMEEQHQKLMEVSEDCKAQVIQARRQIADAELAAVEKTARLTNDLKQAAHDRDQVESQLKQQTETFSLKLSQAEEEAARQIEKAGRQEKHRLELQQLEFERKLSQQEEVLQQRLKQREQELSFALEARLTEEKSKLEQHAGRAVELQHQLEAQAREANARLKHELQQQEQAFEAKLKLLEHEWTITAENRETELQKQWASDLRVREEEWERQAESRVRAAEIRMGQEAQQKEELFLSKSRQRDQQWQLKLDAARAESQSLIKETLRRQEVEASARLHELEAGLRLEMQQKEEAAQAKFRQRETDLIAQLHAQAEAREAAVKAEWETQFETKTRFMIEPFKAQLARTEKERDEARQTASQISREVQNLEKKLTDASSFLSSWRNGKHSVEQS
jgi:hypothetical protein